MKKIDFNDNWFYGHIGENDRNKVDLPHDAMLWEKRTPYSSGRHNISWFEGRDYWYEKNFEVKWEQLNVNVVLEFEGIYKNSEIYINDKKVTGRPYGYSNFYADITKEIVMGINKVRVIVRNSDQPNSRWYSGSGIYRPVYMYLFSKKHIEMNGIKIKTLDYLKGEIEIKVKTNTPGPATIEILNSDKIVLTEDHNLSGDTSIVVKVPDVKLWSTEYPNLYKCRVRFYEDEYNVDFGIRSIECDALNGFRINGQRVVLRGACIHHDNGLLGACAYPYAEKRKVRILKEAGYNAIRSAHNPCSKAILDACDEMGMLMVDELVDCWYIHKTKYDYVNYFDEWWQQDIKSMIDKDMNHPSVIMYSIGNEVSETAQKRGIELSGNMTEYIHALDDSRPVTCGVNIFFNYLSSIGFGVYTDEKAEKEALETKKEKHKRKTVGSEFFNQLAGKLGDKTMKLGATLHGCDSKTKDAFANMDVAGYNYGILRYKKDIKKYPERVILGTETFCKDAASFMKLSEKYPSLIGDFVWAGMDYLGEAGIGSHEYNDYAKDFSSGVGWISAGSGRVDLTGRELSEAAYTKVAFGLEKIHIAVIPVNNYGKPHSPSAWKMTNARNSWSWNGSEGKKTVVEVYAKAHRIKLYVNNKLVGNKRVNKTLRTYFKAKYYSGEVKAVAYDENEREIVKTTLDTAGDETILGIYPESYEINKEELAYIRFKYTDSKGTLKPLARGIIRLDVKGGRLLGFGHACPYNEDGYLNDSSDTYYGEALAIIKPEKEKIELVASSPFGVRSTEIRVK